MRALESLIKEEFDKIKNGLQYYIKYNIHCTIHTPYTDHPALIVLNHSLFRDYIENFSDVISVTCVLGSGTIDQHITPFAAELEATISLRPVADTPDKLDDLVNPTNEIRYKAMLFDKSIKAIESNEMTDVSSFVKDINDVKTITLQLINPLQERLRALSFGGTIRDANPLAAIRYLLTRYSKPEGLDNTNQVVGVNVAEGYDTKVRKHIVVPHQTPIISLPKYICDTVGGIYSTGFQYYLQKNHWYIFSPYDTNAFSKASRTLTIINVSKRELSQVEKTFRLTDTQVILLSTGETRMTRLSDKLTADGESGARYVDANKVLEGYGVTGENKLKVSRKNNASEFLSKPMADMANQTPNPDKQVRYIKNTPGKITAGHLNELSMVARSNCSLLQAVWENAVDGLLFPGMPVRVIYMYDGAPKQVYGTLVSTQAEMRRETNGPLDSTFSNHTILSCYVSDTVNQSEML